VKTYNSKNRFNSGQPGSTPTVSANTEGIMRKNKGKSILLAAAATVASILGAAASPAHAAPILLQDYNSSVTINPTTPSPSGVTNWTVDGTNQMNQEWFWFAVNGGAPTNLNTLSLNGVPTPINIDGNPSAAGNYVSTSYGTSPLKIGVSYDLSGGATGSKVSDLSETATITNTGSSTLTFQFYEYSNFTMGGGGSQTLTITGGNEATQENPSDFMVSQTVVSPKPTYFQADTAANLMAELGSTTNVHLDDNASITSSSAAWAFEWDVTLNPGATFAIGIDKNIRAVPEPTATVALFGLGGLFLTRPRRRDEDPDPRTAQVAEA
jgi:hypothetical protein